MACRREQPPQEMIRIVRTPDGDVAIDEHGKLSGRGAYLCPESACFVLAKKKRLFDKALKILVPEVIYNRLEEKIGSIPKTAPGVQRSELFPLLGLARKAGELIIGQDRVLEQLKQKKLLVIFSEDRSLSLERSIRNKEATISVLAGVCRSELGRAVGLQHTQVIAIAQNSGFARKVGDLLPKGGEAFE